MSDVELTIDPGRPADAGHFFAAGHQLLVLLDGLSDVEGGGGDWQIASLRLGSAVAVLRSEDPSRQEAAQRMTEGLVLARAGRPLPKTWTPAVTADAQTLMKVLGGSDGEISSGGTVVKLDAVLAGRLHELTPWVREMPGSLRGTLTGVNVNRGYRASLRLESGRVVRAAFPSDQAHDMRDALLQFVELEGLVRQDADGFPYWIKSESVRVLRRAPLAWDSLFGFDPDITDGQSVGDYLADLRGES